MDEFQSFTCCECGGKVELIGAEGRMRLIDIGETRQRGRRVIKDVEIPRDFKLPTCTDCNETYISIEYSEELDKLLLEKHKLC